MSKVCYKCDKRYMSGNNVSHSNRKTKRRFKPNLTNKVIVENGIKKKVVLCAKCIKSLHKK